MRRVFPLMMIVSFVLLTGCDGGENVTTRTIANARRVWDAAHVRDYDLEWTTSGARDGHYRVYVRGGTVKSVRLIEHDRRERRMKEIEVKRADMSYYGIDGLFKILEEENAQLREDAPFGQPKGSRVLLKFNPDPKLGYPQSYRRDVMGSPKALAIDVIRFVPNATEAIPPPPA